MVRTAELSDAMRPHVTSPPSPSFDAPAWTPAAAPAERRVALVSSAGLSLRDQRPFRGGEGGYRAIPHDAADADIAMSHISVNFDRVGYQLDAETVFPRRGLQSLVAEGAIGSVADMHYSFMGATDPVDMEDDARALAGRLHEQSVNTVVLLPV